MDSALTIEQKKPDVGAIALPEKDFELEIFDYTDKGVEYRYEADDFDFEYDDFMIRVFGLVITRLNDEKPDIWFDELELWEEDKVDISNKEAYLFGEKLKQSLNIQ